MWSRTEELLRLHEGLRLKPYRCTAGKLTIGIGRNLDDVGITEDEAVFMMRNDIDRVKRELTQALPWWSSLDPVRSVVLVDLAFNLGLPRLLKFTKMLTHLRAGTWDAAANELLASRYATQVGERARRLATMLRSGNWPVELQGVG